MKLDKHSSLKTAINSTIQQFSPSYTKTQPRIIKYKNNRVVNPEQYYMLRDLPEMRKDRKLDREPVRLEKLVKPSKFEKPKVVRSAQLSPENKDERKKQKQGFRTLDDDVMSRVSRLSKVSQVSKGTKFQNKIKQQNGIKQKDISKSLSKQLTMKIRNQSIYNWNFNKNKNDYNKNFLDKDKSVTSDFDQVRSTFSTRSHRIKTEAEAYKNRLEELKQEENELFEDEQIWNNPNLKTFLQYYGIKDKCELYDFLENNQEYSPQLYNIGHINNLTAFLKPQPTEYKRRFRGQNEQQYIPLLKQQDYQTLHRLAMMGQTLKNFTTNQISFDPKPLVQTTSFKPHNCLYLEKKQIVSGTSYEFNYPSRLDYQSKIIQKPKEQHVVVGFPFFGKTQYKNNFIEIPTQSFTATQMAQFFKYKQNDANPMKLNKGINYFNTTYKRQFVSKSVNKDQRIRAQSQLECSVEHPKDSIMQMYLTSTQNDYTKYAPSTRKKQRVDPNKYGALSRLKTILMLNKALKKEITPHIPHDFTILK